MNKIVRIKNKYQFEFFFGEDYELTNEEAIAMVLGVSPEYYNKNIHYIEKPKNQFNTNR